MCEYCCCDHRVHNGAIGKRIGGQAYPVFIMRYDNPIDNYWYYFLVEMKTDYSNDWQDKTGYPRLFNRLIPLNYCPDCGTLLV